MDKQKVKELRKILMGRVSVNEDGWLVALPDEARLVFHGVMNGWSSRKFRKIIQRQLQLELGQDPEESFNRVLSAMQRTGKMVDLECDPDALSCVRRHIFSKSVILSASYLPEGIVQVDAYTGKGVFTPMLCMHVFKEFQKNLQLTSKE